MSEQPLKFICIWCQKPMATDADNEMPDDVNGDELCWREYNSYSSCYDVQARIESFAPELLQLAKYVSENCGGYESNFADNIISKIEAEQ